MSICSVLTACIHLSLVLYGCLYIVLINSSIQISQFPTAWKQTTCDAGLANRYCKECTEMGRCVNLVLTDTTLALSSCRKITRSRKWEKKKYILSAHANHTILLLKRSHRWISMMSTSKFGRSFSLFARGVHAGHRCYVVVEIFKSQRGVSVKLTKESSCEIRWAHDLLTEEKSLSTSIYTLPSPSVQPSSIVSPVAKSSCTVSVLCFEGWITLEALLSNLPK